MAVFLGAPTIKALARNILLTFVVLLSILATGCSDSNHTSKEPTTVFATFDTPATVEAVEKRFDDLVARVEQLCVEIVTAPTPDWQHHLIPLYDLLIELSDATAYNSQLMTRSPDPAVRALGYVGFVQYPQLTVALTKNVELKMVVVNTLNVLSIATPRQQEVADYLAIKFTSEFSAAEQAAQVEADENLTNVSLLYYNNSVTKSASATFTAEEFGCLSEELKSKIPTDISGDYIFDANSSLYYTLSRSCLDESVRERLHAVQFSKAAAENALLWPIIQQQRLSYAQLFGHEDYAALRLSDTIMADAPRVYELLDEVEQITNPAFERLLQRYKVAQTSAEGEEPETIFAWNRDRYNRVVSDQLLSGPVANPHLLTFPDTFDRTLYLVGKIFGLSFVKTGQLENSWNPDVVEYRVYDQKRNAPVATLLVDPYQLAGISAPENCGRIMASRLLDSGARQVPVIVMNLNLVKSSTETTPMSTYAYEGFGHELGHALHFMLQSSSEPLYQPDFIEVPSMFSEKLVTHPEFFKALLSSNLDQPLAQLPADFVSFWNYNRESPQDFCESQRYTLTLSATAMDLTAWQGGMTDNFAEVAKSNLAHYFFPYSSESQPFYDLPYFVMPATDTRYYQYVLADVVSVDILSLFEASTESIFDPQLGQRYREHILEDCGPDSSAAITDFLGREWNYAAFQDWFDEKTQDL